jgi:hypothetical protein
LVLQFAVGGQPLVSNLLPGSVQRGTMLFYPGASQQRAQFARSDEQLSAFAAPVHGSPTIDHYLEVIARELARQPWLSAFGCVLNTVTLTRHDEAWFVLDRDSRALPLLGQDHWQLLALTGGHPFDVFGEWNGRQLRPLGLLLDGKYRVA